MSFIKYTLLISFFLITFNANALVLIEPHLGLNLSGTGHDSTVPAKTFNYTGGQYGLKLGAQYLNAMTGIDYNHSSFEQMTSGYKNSFTRSELGLFLGYSFPMLARFWMTYFFDNTATSDTASSLIANGAKYDGHTLELGAGFSGIPYCSFNFIYRLITLTQYTSGPTTTDLIGNTEVNNHEIVLGISFPFDVF
jgi:hypothetical protein